MPDPIIKICAWCHKPIECVTWRSQKYHKECAKPAHSAQHYRYNKEVYQSRSNAVRRSKKKPCKNSKPPAGKLVTGIHDDYLYDKLHGLVRPVIHEKFNPHFDKEC
jgi:hypothetical protein